MRSGPPARSQMKPNTSSVSSTRPENQAPHVSCCNRHRTDSKGVTLLPPRCLLQSQTASINPSIYNPPQTSYWYQDLDVRQKFIFRTQQCDKQWWQSRQGLNFFLWLLSLSFMPILLLYFRRKTINAFEERMPKSWKLYLHFNEYNDSIMDSS